jgi:hypothetical protein
MFQWIKGRGERLWLLTMMVLSTMICQAQDPDDPSPTDPAVPVDGGISLLLAAGMARGLWQIRAIRLNRNGQYQR